MRKILISTVIAASLLTGVAVAQEAPTAAAPAAAGKISVQTTKIEDLIKNPGAKAALEAVLPEIAGFYDQIGSMTLTDVAPLSEGALDDAKLKALQEQFDKL